MCVVLTANVQDLLILTLRRCVESYLHRRLRCRAHIRLDRIYDD
jgi:hypothetical protein